VTPASNSEVELDIALRALQSVLEACYHLCANPKAVVPWRQVDLYALDAVTKLLIAKLYLRDSGRPTQPGTDGAQ